MSRTLPNILDPRHIDAVFGAIAAKRLDYRLFYEVKVNLDRQQLRALWAGGVRWLQPGIESLSTRVLSLLGKGSSMLDNVRFLKWSRYYGFHVGWNLLWGIPGEHAEDYEQEYRVLQLLGHLEPPNACGPLWLERFAPLVADRQRFLATRMEPEPSYRHAYPAFVHVSRLAFFFEGEFPDTVEGGVHQPTLVLVEQWKASWRGPQRETLTFHRSRDVLFIEEGRRHAEHATHALHGALATLYVLCSSSAISLSDATRALQAEHPDQEWTEAEVGGALAMLCARGWMVGEGGRFLGLAIPANGNW